MDLILITFEKVVSTYNSMQDLLFLFINFLLIATFIRNARKGMKVVDRYAWFRWWKKMTWLLYHPLIMVGWVVLANTILTFPELSGMQLLVRGFSATKHALVLACVDNLVYGNVVFPIG